MMKETGKIKNKMERGMLANRDQKKIKAQN